MKWKKQSNSTNSPPSTTSTDSKNNTCKSSISPDCNKQQILNPDQHVQSTSNHIINQEFTRISNGDESEEVDCAF